MRIIKHWAVAAATVLSAVLGTGVHAAPLLGSTLDYQTYWPNLNSPVAMPGNGLLLVGGGVEIPDFTGIGGASLDITDHQIIFSFFLPRSTLYFVSGTFNGFVLTDVQQSIDDFIGLSIDASTSVAEFDASRVSFTADTLTVNFQGISIAEGEQIVLNIAMAPSEVPEPGTLVLAGLALGGLAVMRKARQRRASRMGLSEVRPLAGPPSITGSSTPPHPCP